MGADGLSPGGRTSLSSSAMSAPVNSAVTDRGTPPPPPDSWTHRSPSPLTDADADRATSAESPPSRRSRHRISTALGALKGGARAGPSASATPAK